MKTYSEVFCGNVLDYDDMFNEIKCGDINPSSNKKRLCGECFRLQRAYEDGIKYANSQQSERENKK